MESYYKIKDRLNEALQLRGMSAADLAKKSGMAKSSLSRYLTGENIPRSIAIGKMAKALDVSPAWLLGYDLTIDGKEPEEIRPVLELDKLSRINQAKVIAYYEGLLASQEGNDGNT